MVRFGQFFEAPLFKWNPGCNPYVTQAATLCDPGCNPM